MNLFFEILAAIRRTTGRPLRLILLGSACAILQGSPPAAGEDWPELVREDFQSGDQRWKAVDPEGWRLEKEGENQFFHQFLKSSPYKPPHRSPLHIAMLRDVEVGDFELTARVKSTHPDYGHRDVCLFFGMRDSAHFYYVHLGKKTDDHANQIFIVDGKDRTKISLTTTEGTDWDDQWHRVKIIRRVSGPEAGAIEVFFDDMNQPIMTARDMTFVKGAVGLGSFDDTSAWDDIVLRGK